MKERNAGLAGRLTGVALASAVGLVFCVLPVRADSESGGVFSVGESEAGVTAESESGGVFNQGFYSESGGVFQQGARSESGGVYSVGESESGGVYSVGETESGGVQGYGAPMGYLPYQRSWLWSRAHDRIGTAGGSPAIRQPAPEVEVKNYTWPASPTTVIAVAKASNPPAVSSARQSIKTWHIGGKNLRTVRGHAATTF